MRVFLTSLILAGAALSASAQDAVLYNQTLSLHYARWQLGQEAASATTLATYDFNAMMPVWDYSLGAFALAGSLDYLHASDGQGSQSALGLNTYGFRATLFPYRPFHISLEYTHAQSPVLAGVAQVKNDVYAVGLNYRGRTVQDLQVQVRKGHTSESGGAAGEDWSTTNLNISQSLGTTRATLMASHQEYAGVGPGAAPAYKDDFLYGSTFTRFSQAWSLQSNVSAEGQTDNRNVGGGIFLSGVLGRWMSLSSFSVSSDEGPGTSSSSSMGSQSLTYTETRYALFGSGALSTQSAQAGLTNSTQGSVNLGGAYNLAANWRVSADVSLSHVRGGQGPGASTSPADGNLRAFHVGISEGGDVPALVKRALFYLSDQAFARRIQEDYAPGYLPSELVQEIQRRRVLQGGNFGFTGELFHTQADTGASLDWVRLTGDLSMVEGLRVFTMADVRRDAGLSSAGLRRDERSVSLNLSENVGISTLSGSVGYARSSQSEIQVPGGSSSEGLPNLLQGAGTSRFYTLTFNSRLLDMPCGAIWTRYVSTLAPATTAVTTHLDWSLGKLEMRVSCGVVHRDDGVRYSQITVDLLRAFDTIAFYGFGRN